MNARRVLYFVSYEVNIACPGILNAIDELLYLPLVDYWNLNDTRNCPEYVK